MPRPIGWISTVSREGVPNLAPYSQFQNLGFDPMMVMVAINQDPDGSRKDTVVNAERAGWFVWNMATYDLRDAVNLSSDGLPPEESEWDTTGLEAVPADLCDIPMVAASPAHYECTHHSTLRIMGDSDLGAIDLMIGRVERIHVAEWALTDGKVDYAKIRPIARMGYMEYAVIDETFTMDPPGGEGARLGLEGRPIGR